MRPFLIGKLLHFSICIKVFVHKFCITYVVHIFVSFIQNKGMIPIFWFQFIVEIFHNVVVGWCIRVLQGRGHSFASLGGVLVLCPKDVAHILKGTQGRFP